MYTDYFNMREMPFTIEPNPRFLMLDEDHREALATLVYAIDQQEGWALLLGEAGVGKTTLIMALLRELRDRVVPAVITNPRLEPLDFFNLLGLELGLEGPFTSKGQFLMAMGQMIKRCHRQNKVLAVIIDEAQSLAPKLLEELRLLGNMDDFSPRVLNIFLVGQPQILLLLKKAGARGLMQRLRRHFVLKPLGPDETTAYIKHRLGVAGGSQSIFDDSALAAVHRITGGNPRLINTLCDDSLLLAFSQNQQVVGENLVQAAAEDNPSLQWPPRMDALDTPASRPEAAPETPDQIQTESVAVPAGPGAPLSQGAPPEEPAGAGPYAQPENAPAPEPAQAHGFETAPEPQPAPMPEPAPAAAPAQEASFIPASQPDPFDPQALAAAAPGSSIKIQPRESAGKRPPGMGSRMAKSMSGKTPGSLRRRVLFLLIIALVVGGIALAAGPFKENIKGFYEYDVKPILRSLKNKVSSLWGEDETEILMPSETADRRQVLKRSVPDGVKDWGPILYPSSLSNNKTGTSPSGDSNG